ncbi:FadR/GntR family transcriptional regulator [Microbacterium rhizophilus]|uniref:FadR/GntR family transcriptional regulator n=1 Tax=Microbacterium rhizophilus TaxID=3138934 RepID=UPI0031EBDDA6
MSETRAWRTVLERIEGDLLEGRLAPGDRLPGERELASTLGVGRSSVREALRVLESMGLVRTASGSGPSSGAMIVAAPQGGVATLLRLQLAARGFPFSDVVATRAVLESSVVDALAVAVRDGADPDLAESESLLAAMDAADLEPDEFLALDARLHLSLAEASGNVVVAAIMAGLRTAIESYGREGAAAVADWPALVADLRAEHAAVLDAVRAGVPELARERIRSHITGFYARAHLTASAPSRKGP